MNTTPGTASWQSSGRSRPTFIFASRKRSTMNYAAAASHNQTRPLFIIAAYQSAVSPSLPILPHYPR